MCRPVRPTSPGVAAALVAGSTAAHRRKVSGAEEQLFLLINGAPDRLHLPVWVVLQSGSQATTLAIIAASRLPPGGRLVTADLAAATGGARIYVGAHLPVDVGGGAAVGVLAGRVADARPTSGRS